MEKEELLHTLQGAKEPAQHLYNIREEFWHYQRPYINFHNLHWIFKLGAFSIVYGIIANTIGLLLLWITGSEGRIVIFQ